MSDPEQLYAQLIAEFTRCNWRQAEQILHSLLPVAASHAGVLGMAGVTSLELKQYSLAENYLRRACELDPKRADFAALHAKALLENGRLGDATVAARQAMALDSDDPSLFDALGVIFTRTQDHRHALRAFTEAAARYPSRATFRFNLATSLVVMGESTSAEREFEACLDIDPTFWKAHLSLAQIRTQSAGSNHIERLQCLLSTHAEKGARAYLNMALASELEDVGQYELSFEHLSLGKAAAKDGARYPLERDRKLFAAIETAFPYRSSLPDGNPTTEPIFVVGMPRSGTTLLDRIVSSHPDVQSAGELQNFHMALHQVAGKNFPFCDDLVARVSTIDWRVLGDSYLESTRPVTGSKPHFIDKLPHNFLYLGLIAKALPNARIIWAKRHPLDTCLSNFRQMFSELTPYLDYSLDLLDIGKYYVLFDRLMGHWIRMFSGRILEVRYEDLLQSQELVTRRMLHFCDLPWNEACLRFEQNKAAVDTLSANQVRRPLFYSSASRWRHYERQLGPLRALLYKAGIVMDE